MRRLSDNDLPWDRTRLMDEKVQRLIGRGRLKIHVGKVTRNVGKPYRSHISLPGVKRRDE